MNPPPAAAPTPTPPTPRRLWRLTAGAFAASVVLFVLVVLPAEFGIDPSGFGRASGVVRLHGEKPPAPALARAPAPTPAPAGGASAASRDARLPYRCDEVDIPLAAGGDPARRDELEYKVRLAAGDSLVYAWRASGVTQPDEFYSDFHGETPAVPPNGRATVVEYRQATGTAANGALTAPIDGVHGWYLQNQSAAPVVVNLKLCGFHTLIEPGAYGNARGIRPTLPARP